MKKDTLYVIIGLLIVILFIIQQNDKDLDIKIFSLQGDEDDDSLDEPKRYYDSKYTTRNRM